ncbi:hypothetical protein M9H77_20200 [Catharanthus roseus]|uniref:Uncharacterized protein n=1 Tax=Catharanthus roseus TaxID=4058 RepID=A0ACC0AKB4_CATRO|nr:hypothetical protein M9H77_20200 [Catharanthus roseus]
MAAFSSSPATTAAHSGAGIGANVLSAIPFAEQLSRMRASQSPPNPLAALSSSSSTAPSVGIGAHAISPISMVMPETSSSKGKAPADSAAGNDNTMTSLAMELLAFHLQNNPQFPDVQTTGGSSDNNNDDDTPYVNLNLGSGIPAPAMAAKRAKGRPRKYGPDGEISIAQMQAAIAHPYGSPSRSRTKSANSSFSAAAAAAGGGSSSVPPSSDVPLTISSTPRVMPSSRNFMSKGTGPALGLGYNPEINTINIKKGEDVFSKIISFSQNTPGSISIVSATGSLSAIALRHPAISDETAIYQGLFGIENMYGTFVPSKFGNFPRKSGGLNITVLGNNGQTIYGQVAGVLIAAAPVKVMIRSFAPNEADNSGVNSGGATGPSNMDWSRLDYYMYKGKGEGMKK